MIQLCEQIYEENQRKPFPAPVIIIHCQLMSLKNRSALLHVRDIGCDLRPSMFPQHTYFFGGYEVTLLGHDRISIMSPCSWADQNNIPFTIHADGPVTPFWPKYIASTACNRTNRDGEVLGKEQTINLEQALRAMTQSVASQIGFDRTGGYGRIRKNLF